MDVINVLEVLDSFFPGHRSPERAAEWEALKNRIVLGSKVQGVVVAQFHFGVFVHINAGFPALLLVPRMKSVGGQPYKSMELYPAIGSTVEARDTNERHCERSEAIQSLRPPASGLLRYARNDGEQLRLSQRNTA